jgi:hypothetical protein
MSRIDFHKTWLGHIKESLGASYVAYENEKDKFFLNVRTKNKEGEQKEIKYSIEGTPNDVTNEDYENLLRQLMTYAKV